MPTQTLYTGAQFSSVEARALETAAELAGDHPESVLYIAPLDHPSEDTRDQWRDYGSTAALRIDTFDGVVSDCYDRDQYKGLVTVVDQPLLRRLAELGVECVDSLDNPFYTGDRFPRAGLVQEAQRLFTELEHAGLLSPEAMRSRLVAEGLEERARFVEEVATAIETARDEILAEDLGETFRTERMHHVTTMDADLGALLPSVDAVVLSGFERFDVLEQDLLSEIVATWPTIAVLPKQSEDKIVTGVDMAAKAALETYLDLGFSRSYCDESVSKAVDARQRIVSNLYRHPTHAPPTDDIDPTALQLEYVECDTIPDEVRETAKEIRSQLANGVAPDDIGVVLTNPTEYSDHVRDVFETYDLPFSLDTEVSLADTALGDLIDHISQLSREPRTIGTLLDLLTNPLVSITRTNESIDHHALSRVAARTETPQINSVLDHVDDHVATAVEDLLSEITALRDTDLTTLPDRLEDLLDGLGVWDTLQDERLPRQLHARESSASDRLDRVLETLALTAPLADLDIGDPVDRLERALAGVSVRAAANPTEQHIVVCGLSDAVPRTFEQVYVLGMTASHVPADPDRMAFTHPIYDAHPDFEQTAVSMKARYHLGTLLSSPASIRLSAPQRSQSGDPYVEADILTELRRILDLSAITTATADTAPGSQEDVQRAIGAAFSTAPESDCSELIDAAVEAGTFTPGQHTRIEAGVACAAARAAPHLTPYDGQLSPEMVEAVHSADDRTPFSASRLETYAACGFKYYMSRVLGIKAPDPIRREPDTGVRGSYVHDVLEHYYRSLQSTHGEPIHPGQDFDARQTHLLDIALERLDTAFSDYPETAFHDAWLTEVLAGLGTPASNDHYGPTAETGSGRPPARGLLYRFLEHEFDEPAKTTARPAWFEARIGDPHHGGTSISDEPAVIETPHGSVPVHGLIDRVDTVPGTQPTQTVVRDYKTGSSTPSEADALLGMNFQLPLYALMAEDALGDVETVGAAYYQVSPPSSVNSRKGLLTSQAMATYYDYDDVDVPLLRHSNPHFETHDAFRRFIEETTPMRLGQLATSISEGHFHPTVLDPSDAGCRYCDYAHVCDVRSYQRRDVIDRIDESDATAYVPLQARNIALDDAVGAD